MLCFGTRILRGKRNRSENTERKIVTSKKIKNKNSEREKENKLKEWRINLFIFWVELKFEKQMNR